MPEVKSLYKKNTLQFGGHLQTLLPYFFNKNKFKFKKRERLILSDGDFIDVDTSLNGYKRCMILSHGLEGHSGSQYIVSTAAYFSKRNWDIIAWNNRGCSGELNKSKEFYHSGKTDDLRELIDYLEDAYDEIYLIGFSMGGNITLTYLAEDNISSKIKGGCVFSVPVDLADSAKMLKKWQQKIYMDNFLETLKNKIKNKRDSGLLNEGDLNFKKVMASKNFHDFDEHVTAKLFGFKSAEAYWDSASSVNKLDRIEVPTLLLNALNDPFLGDACYPDVGNESLYIEFPKYGGHIGFNFYGKNRYWLEERIGAFLAKNC